LDLSIYISFVFLFHWVSSISTNLKPNPMGLAHRELDSKSSELLVRVLVKTDRKIF
jgi:hypothetical protein